MPSSRAVPRWVITEGFVDEEIGTVSAGKEAGCFVVRRSAGERWCLLIRKDYRKRSDRTYKQPVRAGERTFRRDTYAESATIPAQAGAARYGDARLLRAIAKRTALGKEVIENAWLSNEFDMLTRLWEAGVRVPYPVAREEHALWMQYVGSGDTAAPRLADVRPRDSAARELFDRVLDEMIAMTSAGVVHGDLSAYNVLVQHGRPWIIDVPQAVDLYTNRHGPDLLRRDVHNVCAYFAKRGVNCDGGTLADDLLAGRLRR